MVDYLELEKKLSSISCPIHNNTSTIKVEEKENELLFIGEKCCEEYKKLLKAEISLYKSDIAFKKAKEYFEENFNSK